MTEGKDVFTEDEIKEIFGEAFDQVFILNYDALSGLCYSFLGGAFHDVPTA
jgi:hypothetical protein